MIRLKDLRNICRETSAHTLAFLWFIAGDKQLAKFSRELIEDPSNERFLSTAALWEITIKAESRHIEWMLTRRSCRRSR